jgi:hypothetical protein
MPETFAITARAGAQGRARDWAGHGGGLGIGRAKVGDWAGTAWAIGRLGEPGSAIGGDRVGIGRGHGRGLDGDTVGDWTGTRSGNGRR